MQTLYRYAARSPEGTSITGSMTASSVAEALARLRVRRLSVTSLEEDRLLPGSVAAIRDRLFFNRISRVAFFRSLAILTQSGTTLTRALTVAASQCGDKSLAETIGAVSTDLEAGSSLSEACARRPMDFPQSVVAMIRAGEVGGILDDVFQLVAEMLEREDATRRRLHGALAYPAFVLCAAVLLIVFLLVVMVPALEGILTQLHAAVPVSTQALIAASSAARNPVVWMAAFAALCGLGAIVVIGQRRTRVKRFLDAQLLRLPILGRIRKSANIAAFCRTTGMLLTCGVSLAMAVEAAANVVTSTTFRDASVFARGLILEGEPLSVALERCRLFGALCAQAAVVGEQAGTLDATVLRLAAHFETELGEALRNFVTLVEPALILVVGCVVGGTVSAILIPLYSAVGSIR